VNNSELLAAILPEGGPYLLAVPAQFTNDENKVVNYFKHFAYDDVPALLAEADRHSQTKDVYFALGSVKEVRPKKVRKAENIARVSSFWLDLDIKPGNDKHYPDQRTAATQLKGFIGAMGLPDPCIVDSGGGLHVYWLLSESIDADQWVHYATKLKQATKQWGLKADPMRTADVASVLRVPGTFNHKYGEPKEVRLVVTRGAVPPKQFLAALAAIDLPDAKPIRASVPDDLPAAMKGALPEHLQKAGSKINQEAAGGLSGGLYAPADPRKVVARCRQMSWQAANPELVEEPQWYDMVGCLRHAGKGDKAIHAMSKRYSKYSASETDQKINHHTEQGIGPTLCATFEDHNPGGCQGCPYAGKISTPLQTGQEYLAAPPPVAERPVLANSTAMEDKPLPDPPFPFKRVMSADGKSAKIAIKLIGDEGVELEEVIYDYDIYPQSIIYDEREGRYVVEVRRWLPQDGWELFPLPLGSIYDRRKLSTTLGDIGVLPDLGKIDLLVQYMIGYLRELQKHSPANTIYAQLGWRDNGRFVLGDRVVEKDRVLPVNVHKNIANTLSWQEPRGDVTQWRKVVEMYEKPGLEGFLFGIGVGFAAPLFRFTNFNGMIVSMVGEKGCGKSSVMQVANSIWGHKTHGWVDLEHDTMRAFYNKLGVLKNLPACYDEVTNLDEQNLSDLCYAISKGQGRQRLNQDGSAKENHGSWQTMMLTTSNASLHSRLALAKADASAESVRVFEYYLPNNMIKKAEADERLDIINDHFGLAGELFIRAVMNDLDAVKASIKKWTRYMEETAGVNSGERFWAAAPACVLAAFEVSNRIGLTSVDVERIAAFSVQSITNMRESVVDNTRTSVSVLGDFLNGNFDKMLTLNTAPVDGKVAFVAQEPRNELRIRFEAWHNVAYIDRAYFRSFCASRHIDINRLKSELKKRGILKDETRMVLGRDTGWKTSQVWTWVFNMAHPDLGNTVGAATSANAAEIASGAMAAAQESSR
jgi:energy-coupling factor transporter ATP-binding protein EcfA2